MSNYVKLFRNLYMVRKLPFGVEDRLSESLLDFFESGYCTVTLSSTRHRAKLETLNVDADNVKAEFCYRKSLLRGTTCTNKLFRTHVSRAHRWAFWDIAWPASYPVLSMPVYIPGHTWIPKYTRINLAHAVLWRSTSGSQLQPQTKLWYKELKLNFDNDCKSTLNVRERERESNYGT